MKTICKMSKLVEGLLAKNFTEKQKTRYRMCVRKEGRVREIKREKESESERVNIFANILPGPDFSIWSQCR